MPSLAPESLMEKLGAAQLDDGHGKQLTAAQLWSDRPAVVLVLRRPGCVLCRAEAQRLWKLHNQFESMGVNLVCVVHEWREREIEAYAPEFWGGPVYHDLSKAFYKAVNGGQQVLKGSALGLLNPFSAAWKRINEARKEVSKHNVVGEGLIMGGLMVVGKGGSGPYFVHLEIDLGVHAEHTQVLAAAKRAAADAGSEPSSPLAATPDMSQTITAQ